MSHKPTREDKALAAAVLIAVGVSICMFTFIGYTLGREDFVRNYDSSYLPEFRWLSDYDDTFVVAGNGGGSVEVFRRRWEVVSAMGLNVVVDGECASACTLIFANVPPERVCMTSRASFGFHAVTFMGVPAPDETKRFVEDMPAIVQNWLNQHGPLTTKLIYMKPEDLRGHFRYCYQGEPGVRPIEEPWIDFTEDVAP